jgi:alpha-glucosidase
MSSTQTEHTFLKGPTDWWRQAVVYQIYPRSFADANGDGIGDLAGITSRIGYLKKLGVDAVWMSPFYPSALADGGYDVDDYRNVDPRIGTLDEFDAMLNEFHRNGIRIIVDIVPNHSGSGHEWFQAAIKSAPGSPERARYIFRDGKGENGEIRPSELHSHFGPTGWTHESEMGGTGNQWYLHLFAKEQPDFNWDNPEVREDFEKTIKFWCDRGVDGFRIDVAHAMIKDMSNGKLPVRHRFDAAYIKDNGLDDLFDRDEIHDIYKSWRKIFNQYDPPRMGVAEANVQSHRLARYASEEGLGQSFNFDMMHVGWNFKKVKHLAKYHLEQSAKTGSSTTWVLSNHDSVRHATRFGHPDVQDFSIWYGKNRHNPGTDTDLGLARAKAMTMLLLALPGSTYMYQGEELGLPEVFDIPDDQMQDPQFARNPEQGLSRDGCRVPLPWTKTGSSFGFGPGGAHLPQPAWYANYSVEAEELNQHSPLNFYRRALELRREVLQGEKLEWIESKNPFTQIFGNKNVMHFLRTGGWRCITNFGSRPIKLPAGEVLLASGALIDGKLPGSTTVWIRG